MQFFLIRMLLSLTLLQKPALVHRHGSIEVLDPLHKLGEEVFVNGGASMVALSGEMEIRNGFERFPDYRL
jgi:hypothetical protein